MNRVAFDEFCEAKTTSTLTHEDGDYLAICSFVAGAWGYVVYHKGEAHSGRRDWNMDAYRACERALEVIRHDREP